MNPARMNGGTPPVVAQLTVKMLADGNVSTSYSGPGRDALNVMIARVQQDLVPKMIAEEKAKAEKVIEVAPSGLVFGQA